LTYCIRYKVVVVHTSTFILSLSLFISGWTYPKDFESYARCPNGSHKSPSGNCESVVKSTTKLPRCPNGFHRSPDGDCEAVSSSSTKQSHCPNGTQSPSGFCESVTGDTSTDTSSSSNSINNNPSFFNNPQQQAVEPQNNIVVPSNMTTNSNTSLFSSMPVTPVNNAPLLNASTSGKCDQSLWNHVYHTERLQIIDSCKSVFGKIESKKSEADGDFHIRLKQDPQFSNLMNSANINGQRGDLVVEPICQHTVTESIAAAVACSNFHQNINIPEVGSHVNVTGSYVLDKEHNGWAGIHPVTSIIKIPM
jgi:hypothetical protein